MGEEYSYFSRRFVQFKRVYNGEMRLNNKPTAIVIGDRLRHTIWNLVN